MQPIERLALEMMPASGCIACFSQKEGDASGTEGVFHRRSLNRYNGMNFRIDPR
jgi:hypothetical protein